MAPTLFMGGLQAFQAYIKQRMEASLETRDLITLTLPAAEVEWYEEGREIMVQDRMFDIKHYEVKNGVFTAKGMYDDDETEVVNLMKGHWSERDQQHFVIQLLLLSHCILLIHFFFFSFKPIALRSKVRLLLSTAYLSPFLAILVPPPKPLFSL